MAISTSSQSVDLPGIGTTIQVNIDEGINTNSKMLSILQNSAQSTGVATITTNLVGVNTTLQSNVASRKTYPTFATYSCYQNQPGYTVWDSEMMPIHGGYLNADGELNQTWTGWNYTTGNIGQGSSSYFVAATPFNQADGNWLVQVPGSVGIGQDFMYGKSRDTVRDVYSRFGVMVGQEGIRAIHSIYFDGVTIGLYPRGGTGALERFAINTATYSTWHGGTNTNYGMIGYNDRTRTLVVIEAKDAANAYRAHIWRNTNAGRSLNEFNFQTGNLHRFLSEAKEAGAPTSANDGLSYYYNDFTWQANNSQNYAESRYRMMVFPADNGVLGMTRMVPSNVTHYATFEPNYAGVSGTLTNRVSINATTSYGIDQGSDFGVRHQITWDNNWVAGYAVYYYYACGMNVIFANTQDPSKYYWGQNGSGSNGCQLVPWRKDKFIFNASDSNADYQGGMRLYTVDLGGAMRNGRTQSSTISNGAQIPLQDSTFAYNHDTRYTSTNYPVLLSPDYWTNG